MQWQQGDYTLSDESSRLDLPAVIALLTSTYWAAERPAETTERSLRHSLNFSLFHGAAQVGFARVVTDRATVGYLCDVVIADPHRGNGQVGPGALFRIDVHGSRPRQRLRQDLAEADGHGDECGAGERERGDGTQRLPYQRLPLSLAGHWDIL